MSPSHPGASRLLSVNVARPVPAAWLDGRPSAMAKQPVRGEVGVGRLGLDGDGVGDTRYHGGPDQAVYAYAREDLDLWGERLGHRLTSGFFGENLTTTGIDVNAALIGERWRVGTALLEVCAVRIPCRAFGRWLEAAGLDATAWVKRFTVEARPGPYLRVVEEGRLRSGDAVVVETRPDHDITVATMFRALTTQRSLLPELLRASAASERVKDKARAYVAAHPGAAPAALLEPA